MTSQFGALVRALRLEAGLTQEQLADRSRLGVRTIHRLETGKPTDARMGTVKQVAHALADALRRDRDALWTELLAAHRERGGRGGGAATEAPAEPLGEPLPEPSPDPSPPPAGEPAGAPPTGGSAEPGPEPIRLSVPPAGSTLVEAAETLARELHSRWIREEEQRRLHDPFPLPVRWRTAADGLLDHWDNIRGTPPGSTSGPLRLDGGLADVATVYRRIRSGRLVVLGRAGSGKSVLMLRFVLDYLGTRAADEPVPVIFSIGSWDPTVTTLRDWLIRRLLRDHPNLDARVPGRLSLAAALVDAGWILPVLDGFDEIAKGLHGAALEELNTISLPLLLTSRTEQFTEAAAIDVLRRAAGIELTDLTTSDLLHYLPRTARPTAVTVWDPVLDQLRRQPDSRAGANLATVLSTPLMVLLARTIYSDAPGRDSAALLDTARFPTPESLEEHLLAGYVPTVYRRRTATPLGTVRPRRTRAWDPQRAQHYLGYLARHLDRPEQRDHQDLAWWQLPGSLRLSSRVLAVVLACSLITVAADWLVVPALNLLAGRGAGYALRAALAEALFGPTVGLTFGVAYGLLVVMGSAVFEPSRVQLRLPGLRERRGPAGRRGGGGSARRFPTWCSAGVLGGFAVGLGYGPALTVGVQLTRGQVTVNGQVLKGTAVNSLVFGIVFAMAGGLVLGLVAALETPLDLGSAATPADLLAVNRTTVLRQALVLVPLLAAVIAFGGRLVTDLFQGLLGPLSWPLSGGLTIGAVGGLTGGLCYAVAFTAWGQWVLFTRIWLPLTGRLPWATVAFLNDAYHRGVLRQVGAVYQFRHARLQSHLSVGR
ncbi:helix-turn-helix domain-containing protein [Kitasatospora sp. LaBMicrA B282]|uniref:helix-turn-helix domain-containing protein n=1 Tax=Kitasatospora sp. LaBMicrA B282 TaxID=3420949 RepID=UPI003D1368C0